MENQTKTCPECKSDIPADAMYCARCGARQKKQYTKVQIISAIILFFGIIWLINSIGSFDVEQQTKTAPDEAEAYVIARNYVKLALKSPATADFPLFDETSINLGDGRFRSSSYVDSQNSFGATVRSNWTAVVKYNSGEWADSTSWTLEELTIDGQQIVP